MPSPGRIFTVSISENNLASVEQFLDWAEPLVSDRSNNPNPEYVRVIQILRTQIESQRPRDRKAEREKAVQALRDLAAEYSAKACSRKDPALRKCARDDQSDIEFIADYLSCEEDALAAAAMRNLDTSVREEIPRVAWRFLGIRPPHG